MAFDKNQIAACALTVCLSGCTPLVPREHRPAPSTLECAQRVLEDKLPAGVTDDMAHCLAAGLIARYCSVSEAYVAALGKEIQDALGPGDLAWRDWQEDRRGIACARHASDDDALFACCGLASGTARATP